MPDLDSIGGRLRYARNCNRFTVKLVVKYLSITKGWSVERVQAYETGKTRIPLDVVGYLGKLYRVPLEWLLNGGEPPCQPYVKPVMTKGQQLMARCFGTGEPKPADAIRARAKSAGRSPSANW